MTSPPPRPDLAPGEVDSSAPDLAPPPATLKGGARSRGEVEKTRSSISDLAPGARSGARSQNPTRRQWDPDYGKQIGPAWRAIVANLSDREHGSAEIAIAIAMRAGGFKRKTAKNLIGDAIRHGYLTVERIPTTRSRTFRRIRLTDAGCASAADVTPSARDTPTPEPATAPTRVIEGRAS